MPLSKRRSEHKSIFTTNNTRPNQKKQPHGSARTHFDTGFNNSNVAMYRPTIIFLLPHKTTNVKKPKQNYIKQSQQTIQNLSIKNTPKTTTTNNPHNLSIKNTPKTNHNKQTRKTISSIKRKINHKNNHSKQSVKTNTTNYLTNRKINHTNNHDQNNPLNQKHAQNKHNKQLRQNAMFLNIIISQTATTSEPTANTPFIKTQRKYTRLNNITYTLR